MLPSELKPEQFSAYPPLARSIAIENIEILRVLPLSFLPLLLRELIAYDWRFPSERKEIDVQFEYLKSLSPEQRRTLMAGFDGLKLSHELESQDWVNYPVAFSEALSAHLWATHQIPAFRNASIEYVNRYRSTATVETLPIPRLGLVLIGQGLSPEQISREQHRVFLKLRPYGVFYSQVQVGDGLHLFLETVNKRAKAHPVPYAHWYIDGALAEVTPTETTTVDYRSMDPMRATLLGKIRGMVASGKGPEAVRDALFHISPQDVGFPPNSQQQVLDHFRLSLLTEGSGTQIFSTTFVQWTAREALRRAQPLTLLSRFTPRQGQRSMEEMLSGLEKLGNLDAEGSLIDADMGAYYTWINMQRLPWADKSSFVVWFENTSEVFAISPSLPRGTESKTAIRLSDLLSAVA
jgi:hypothetical protein